MAYKFCDCSFPSSIEIARCKGHIPDLLKCRCGEYVGEYPWQWDDSENLDVMVLGKDIVFHHSRSRGTAIVKGKQSLQPGMIHYWEMLAVSPLFGTDVMFGIGTQNLDLGQYDFRYVSGLGLDAHSWGLSYFGRLQHGGKRVSYCHSFSQGTLIGVYLDRSRGHIEFYLNRTSLGVAFTNVPVDPDVKIYPMVCSTAGQSVIRLINCTSVLDTMQLRSFQSLSNKHPAKLSALRQIPGLRQIFKSYWFLDFPFFYSKPETFYSLSQIVSD
ncbi:SPRY domain-containing SOCS box protein 3-like [Drosophila eugracilis]|uniref:SPRY domain-containing SOCS box protein 3-like n=1 Tax=Drosophila eugracilis TaxID=29029 RepID=UPI0007E612A0|nr:SPRY domain-containing SOCS box protein 3-like [Drosophila eugracilis]